MKVHCDEGSWIGEYNGGNAGVALCQPHRVNHRMELAEHPGEVTCNRCRRMMKADPLYDEEHHGQDPQPEQAAAAAPSTQEPLSR